MSTSELTAYIFAGGMVCIGLCALGGCVYLFRRRSQERARELAMEQELADMIVRQRGVKHEILQARRMEDGLNGTAFRKQKQLQMLQEARANLINVQNAHLMGEKNLSSKRKPKISQVQPAALEVKDDDSDNENRRKKKKRKSKVKKRKSKVKKKKTKRAKRSKSRRGESSDNNDSDSDTDISSSGGLSASKDSVGLGDSGIAKTPKKIVESTNNNKSSIVAKSSSDSKGRKSLKSPVQKDLKTEATSQNLPKLASPVRQNEKLDVIDSAQNVKADLSIEHWQPSSIQIHFYEESFKVADAKGKGKIKGKDAVKFLSKSGLSREILRKIWALSDFKKVGYLDKQSFLVACRFVAIIQYGVLPDDPEGEALTLDIFKQHMNNDKVPLPQFDS